MANEYKRWDFPKFAELPCELRHMIWTEAIQPLFIVTFRKGRTKYLGLATPLMSTCAESRRVVQYEVHFALYPNYVLYPDMLERKFGIGEATWIKGKRVVVLPEILDRIHTERMYYCPGGTQLIRPSDSSSRFFVSTFTHSRGVASKRDEVARMIPSNVQSQVLSRLLKDDQETQAFALHILQAKMQGIMRRTSGYFEIVGYVIEASNQEWYAAAKKREEEKGESLYEKTLDLDEKVGFIVKVAEKAPEGEGED